MSNRISLTERLVAWRLACNVLPKFKGMPTPDRRAEHRNRIRRKVKALLAQL